MFSLLLNIKLFHLGLIFNVPNHRLLHHFGINFCLSFFWKGSLDFPVFNLFGPVAVFLSFDAEIPYTLFILFDLLNDPILSILYVLLLDIDNYPIQFLH